MRPKITFRDPQLKRFFRGVPRCDDVDLDNDLRESMTMWRAKYRRFADRSSNPDNQSIKATLRMLVAIPSKEASRAVQRLDSATHAHLKRAAWLDYRLRHPTPAPIPERIVIAPRLGELAALALKTFPKDKGGAPRISGLDHQFAVALVTHWNRLNPNNPPRVQGPEDDPSDFMNWVWEMFERVGRSSNRGDGTKPLSEKSLPRILSAAIKAVKAR